MWTYDEVAIELAAAVFGKRLEEHRGRPATGRSQEFLLTTRIHDTWKVVKGMSSFNFDLIFDSDL